MGQTKMPIKFLKIINKINLGFLQLINMNKNILPS